MVSTSTFTVYLPVVAKNYPPPVYVWLSQQQDSSTGLVSNQQDDVGANYVNALAVMVFTLKNDHAKAKKILDYYNGRASEFFEGRCSRFDLPCSSSDPCDSAHPCGFFQSRNPKTGEPDRRGDRWIGDMAWLLMAIHHYQAKTADSSYVSDGKAIVNLLKHFQQQSVGCVSNGWITGDKEFDTDIYAEGNLDAYKALFLVGETLAASQLSSVLITTTLAQRCGKKAR